MNSLEQFSKMKYLNLETFRKSGQGMQTPVWFVQFWRKPLRSDHGKFRQGQTHPE